MSTPHQSVVWMKLTVVIVSYNVKYYLEQCLDSLKKSLEGIEAEVFVVDNHSQDESVEYLQARFPDVHFIALQHNIGFARANNIAIKSAKGSYVLLLNPDTIVAESTLHEALQFLDAHEGAGAVGVRMMNPDGTDAMESRRGIPTPMTAFYKMSGLCACFPESRRFARYYMSYLPWDEPAAIEVVSGAFFLVRRKVLDEVGLLDTDYFMYGEDIDLSYRICKAGWENWYLPLRILHYKGLSTRKSSFRYVHVFYKAMLIFFRKHFASLSFWLSIPIKGAIYFKALTALMSMAVGTVRKSLGFFPGNADGQESVYVFAGSEDNRKEFMRLMQEKGLEVLSAEDSPAEGSAKRLVFMVYDTDTYSYMEIFNQLSSHSLGNVKLGTYSPHTRVIITESEVII